jgi:disulfide bond formation protein DsbB
MTTDTFTLFFALLAVLAQLAVAAAVVLAIGSRLSSSVASFADRVVAVVAPQAMAMAAVVALVATMGSLYLSEVADFPPCRLCWFQRIAMYPLVVVLGVGVARRDGGARLPGAILALIGAGISVWHLLIERYPTLESGSCDPANPCSIKWVTELGYLTIPGMALSGFLVILVLIGVARLQPKESS